MSGARSTTTSMPVARSAVPNPLERRRQKQWRRLMSVIAAMVLVLVGLGAQAAMVLRPQAPPLQPLRPPTLQPPPMEFSKLVADGKPWEPTATDAPVTRDELVVLIAALERTEHVQRTLKQNRRVAAAIMVASRRWSVDPLDLAALGWIESRFRPDAVSRSGACGMFQQLPRYARPWPTSCRALMNPTMAAFHAGAFIDRYRRRWGPGWTCHYNGGIVCGPRALTYAARHAQVRQQLGKALVRLRLTPDLSAGIASASRESREAARALLNPFHQPDPAIGEELRAWDDWDGWHASDPRAW